MQGGRGGVGEWQSQVADWADIGRAKRGSACAVAVEGGRVSSGRTDKKTTDLPTPPLQCRTHVRPHWRRSKMSSITRIASLCQALKKVRFALQRRNQQ